jgi:hypothetical protein
MHSNNLIKGVGFLAFSALLYSVCPASYAQETPTYRRPIPVPREQTPGSSLIQANAEEWATYVSFDEVAGRCYGIGDSLDSGMATPRMQWGLRCAESRMQSAFRSNDFREYAISSIVRGLIRSRDALNRQATSARRIYQTYATINTLGEFVNPHNWQAPPIAQPAGAEDCYMPPQYDLVGFCVESCYVPGQQLQLPAGDVDVKQLHRDLHPAVVTLTAQSNLDDLNYQATPIDYYVREISDGWHNVVSIKTIGGKVLTVTTNHPVVRSNGQLSAAGDLNVGDELVNAYGQSEPIIELQQRNHYGRVYNLFLKSNDQKENIVIAQGLLNGSAYYQNEGVRFLNRLLLRTRIPHSAVVANGLE